MCTNGTTCDSQDGYCKCGGKLCTSSQICDNTSKICSSEPACTGVICAAGFSCDPTIGQCKCHGVECGPGYVCLSLDAGGCQPDLCYGVHCAGADEGIECIQGVCRCGRGNGDVTVDDPVCSRIQHCQDGQCTTILGCDSVPPCEGYNVCNPLDLRCHCGTRNGPICDPPSNCESSGPLNGDAGPGYDGGQFFYCRTEGDCHQTHCGGGQICDPNQNYDCVCETAPGLGGPPCQQNEYCIALDATQPPTCTASCDVYLQQECQSIGDAGALNCYAELEAGAAVCETPNPSTVGEGDPCGVNADCAAGLGCWLHASGVNGDAGPIVSTCRRYCDSLDGGGVFPCAPPQQCTPVALVEGPGQLIPIGFCE